jgi:PAS domain-containing protein
LIDKSDGEILEMTRKCKSCNGELDTTEYGKTIGADSDGLCSSCIKKSDLQEGMSIQEFIDNLIVAIIVLDQRGSIQTVNEKARALFNKELFFFKGRSIGKVFECEYAELSEGCGETVHCSGCAIKTAVTETFTTGNPVFRMEATLKDLKPGEQLKIHYYISTRKRGEAVLLQIEEAE